MWLDKPDEQGWWWYKWDDSTRDPEPRWITKTGNFVYVESYTETDGGELYECRMRSVDCYKGKWQKCLMPKAEGD